MTTSVTLVFPHQLFKEHTAVQPGKPVYLVEEALFFNQFNFHKQKLVLHRASMKAYQDFLQKKKIHVQYIEAISPDADVRKLIPSLAEKGVKEICYAETADDWLERRIQAACTKWNIERKLYKTPNFLTSLKEAADYFGKKTGYFQTDFYIWQRKQHQLLTDARSQPVGGKWSYDAENRQKFPRDARPPQIQLTKENSWVDEARTYVEQHYGKNYGHLMAPVRILHDGFYPVTFEDAEQWLDQFLEQRFSLFGAYQDAIVARENYLYHSVSSPLLNIGLLDPQQIINTALEAAPRYKVPLNSLEGFIRQLLGWREFIRIVYEREGRRQRTKNFWGFTRKIPASFWKGTTGIVPVDSVIKKLLDTGYSHHIERLMVMANFMLLCEFDPDEVYKWFMEMYIDSYDWVMVPNVYGMTQFADGGLMATKPYISGSNYLLKMGDYKRGPWQTIWDGLFWRFMHVNRDFFSQNARLGMLLNTFDKMPKEKRAAHMKNAEDYLNSLEP
ncbi:MAG: cryptochrome/photolyase family protein [Williamsia sp.]|nr:cryptochrome/photolyase family protein [Williamsia sp.]